jgi:hypothetical protein
MVNGSRLFDGCTLFIVVDRELITGLLVAENGSAYILKPEHAVHFHSFIFCSQDLHIN